MKFYLGVTDTDWFRFLREYRPEEINFWQPRGSGGFKVLPVGGPFLFKLKAPYHAIGGIGFFASHTRFPLSVAWEVFKEGNGSAAFGEFRDKILRYRRDGQVNPEIGCIVLTDPIFFDEQDWIPVPSSWGMSIVQGKSYSTEEVEGKELWSKVQYTLQRYRFFERPVEEKARLVAEPAGEFREVMARIRIGQGVFRTLITDVYKRKCAISGERTLPVLEAAHIKPYAQSGPHSVANGLLLRSDLHKLFDSGYVTVTGDHRIEVSHRIREEFENGKEYYRFEGQPLILPDNKTHYPDGKWIEWHNQNVFR